MEPFGSKSYWEKEHRKVKRLSSEEDYGSTAKEVFQVLELYLKPDHKNDKILHIGCGMSALCPELWRRGWTNVTNVDYSQTAIDRAKDRDQHLHGTQYMCMDCTNMSNLPSGSFDYIIEKGLLDSIFCSIGAIRNVKSALSEVARLLKPGGYFISISTSPRECRLPHLMRPEYDWSVDNVRVPMEPGFFAFACNKRSFHREWFFPDHGALQVASNSSQNYHPPFRTRMTS